MKKQLFSGSKWFLGLASASAILVAISEFADTPINAQSEQDGTTTITANSIAVPAAPGTEVSAKEKSEPELTPDNLSPGMTEIIKLAQAHVSDEVLLAYIKNSNQPFNPTADEIVYLSDLGISDKLIAELIHYKPSGEVAQSPQPEPKPAPVPATNVAPEPEVAPPIPAAVVPAPAPQQVTVNYFYDSLAPYGTWIEVPDYGRCWRPTVVVMNSAWRPYCDRGRWVYTDCGWYWQSDYSWGWAPFHYGRWQNDIRFGWVWVPDTVWGPSWVCWRRNDSYCGWAPLPPRARFDVGVGFTFNHGHVGVGFDFGISDSWFTFVSYNRFCDPHPYRYCAPRHQVTTIYKNSTVINNYIVNNNTIINEGVGRDHIAAVTHKEIHKVTLRDVPQTQFSHLAVDRVDKGGKSIGVFRPKISTAPAQHITRTGFAPVRAATPATTSNVRSQSLGSSTTPAHSSITHASPPQMGGPKVSDVPQRTLNATSASSPSSVTTGAPTKPTSVPSSHTSNGHWQSPKTGTEKITQPASSVVSASPVVKSTPTPTDAPPVKHQSIILQHNNPSTTAATVAAPHQASASPSPSRVISATPHNSEPSVVPPNAISTSHASPGIPSRTRAEPLTAPSRAPETIRPTVPAPAAPSRNYRAEQTAPSRSVAPAMASPAHSPHASSSAAAAPSVHAAPPAHSAPQRGGSWSAPSSGNRASTSPKGSKAD